MATIPSFIVDYLYTSALSLDSTDFHTEGEFNDSRVIYHLYFSLIPLMIARFFYSVDNNKWIPDKTFSKSSKSKGISIIKNRKSLVSEIDQQFNYVTYYSIENIFPEIISLYQRRSKDWPNEAFISTAKLEIHQSVPHLKWDVPFIMTDFYMLYDILVTYYLHNKVINLYGDSQVIKYFESLLDGITSVYERSGTGSMEDQILRFASVTQNSMRKNPVEMDEFFDRIRQQNTF